MKQYTKQICVASKGKFTTSHISKHAPSSRANIFPPLLGQHRLGLVVSGSSEFMKRIEGAVIDLETGGTGGTCPQDFAINKEVPFLFSENALFLKEKSALKVSCPKFEMLPTSLGVLKHCESIKAQRRGLSFQYRIRMNFRTVVQQR